MYNRIIQGDSKLAVIGLGYAGLPLALALGKHVPVIAYDIKEERVAMMKQALDPHNETPPQAFNQVKVLFTSHIDDLRDADLYIITVPTPIDEHGVPDLAALYKALNMLGLMLQRNNYVVVESPTYPGCLEEECIPMLEAYSRLRINEDFKLAYVPHRIMMGQEEYPLEKTMRIVAGSDKEACQEVSRIYELIVEAGVYQLDSIKAAEAAKLMETMQRDINVAFMNEMSMALERMDINTSEVLDAAKTSWHFLNFEPGLVGGHALPVGGRYFSYKAKDLDFHTRFIDTARMINDEMPQYIAHQIVKQLLIHRKNPIDIRLLVMGITYKANISDIRNSKVIDLINELRNYNIDADVVDPLASTEEVRLEYGFFLNEKVNTRYDAVLVAVKHHGYLNLDEAYFKSICLPDGIIFDISGIYKGKINDLNYWCL